MPCRLLGCKVWHGLSGQQIQEALQAEEAALDYAGQPYRLRHLADVLGAQQVGHDFAAEERFPVVFIQSQGQASGLGYRPYPGAA